MTVDVPVHLFPAKPPNELMLQQPGCPVLAIRVPDTLFLQGRTLSKSKMKVCSFI